MGTKWIHKGGHSRPDKRTVKKGGKKKQTLLEFLEGCLCGMVNKVSTAMLYDIWRHYWISDCPDI